MSIITEALRSTAMLASLSLSAWHAGRTDRAAAATLDDAAHAVRGATRVVKNRLAGADAPLRAIISLDASIRAAHRQMTYLWGEERGARLLPSRAFDNYARLMERFARQREDAVARLVEQWPGMVATARANLGALAADVNYPTSDEIGRYFTMSVDYSPLPDRQGWAALPRQTADHLNHLLESRARECMLAAMREAVADAREAAERIERVLASDKPRVFDTLLDDAHAAVPRLRLFAEIMRRADAGADADRLEALAAMVERATAGVTPDALRESEAARSDLLDDVRRINGKLDAWGL